MPLSLKLTGPLLPVLHLANYPPEIQFPQGRNWEIICFIFQITVETQKRASCIHTVNNGDDYYLCVYHGALAVVQGSANFFCKKSVNILSFMGCLLNSAVI